MSSAGPPHRPSSPSLCCVSPSLSLPPSSPPAPSLPSSLNSLAMVYTGHRRASGRQAAVLAACGAPRDAGVGGQHVACGKRACCGLESASAERENGPAVYCAASRSSDPGVELQADDAAAWLKEFQQRRGQHTSTSARAAGHTRAYTQHNVHARFLPLLQEAALAFGAAFVAMLRSERCGEGGGAGRGQRGTAHDLENNLRKEERPPRVAVPWAKMSTTYSWGSMWRNLGPAVQIARDECLGADGERVWDTFRRLVMEDLEYGDQAGSESEAPEYGERGRAAQEREPWGSGGRAWGAGVPGARMWPNLNIIPQGLTMQADAGRYKRLGKPIIVGSGIALHRASLTCEPADKLTRPKKAQGICQKADAHPPMDIHRMHKGVQKESLFLPFAVAVKNLCERNKAVGRLYFRKSRSSSHPLVDSSLSF
ncbi:hypothetical protein GGX14DRAFT_405642 [Mycena pura]|uniref:Uncharacterized protein n=1 Tax=Mycena pura TaxID=153505 RepID=A0AAD6UTC3_9AGAR|nr:hypothetical protein GGX14DRAFT_405642 [Mycena pura]